MEAKTNSHKLKPHPQENSNFILDLIYWWTIPIFRTGLKKELSDEDIYQTLKRHDANRLGNKLENVWNRQIKQGGKPSLWKAIWSIFKWDILLSIFINFIIEFGLKMARPFALGKLMGYYLPDETALSKDEAIMYASIIVLASFLNIVIANQFFMHFQQLGLKQRTACISLLYRKCLKLSKKALSETTLGHIINLLSNDISKLSRCWATFSGLITAPFQAALILYLLYYTLGLTGLVGFVFILVLIPLQMFMSKKSAVYRLRIAAKTDERIRHMNEIISGIQVIKVYTWEIPFVKLIDAIRRKEMYLIKIGNFLQAVNQSLSYFIDKTAIFICIVVYVLTGNAPTAQYVYVLSAFYSILMNSLSFRLPWGVSQLLQANVSVKRLEAFLQLDEIKKNTSISKNKGLIVENATAKWSSDSITNTLTHINLSVEPGELVAIIGPIGSGKSSLLQMCLGELSLSEGTIKTGGRISYANQEPWLFGSTVKQNILFGEPMDNDKYKEVIKACALEEDLTQFPYGDTTIVGERGILLSGGQKARINLARAIYRDADIYLLDDPLSAVDASVGKQIFNNCIRNYLKGKSVVLVTHQVQYLHLVDKIYLVVNGAITASGTYRDLQASGEDFSKLLKNTENFESEDVNKDTTVNVNDKKEQEEEKEKVASGKVSRKIYNAYIQACGSYFRFFVLCFLFIFTEFLATGSNYFITFWVNLEQKRMSNNNSDENVTDILFSYNEDLYFTEENCIYIYSCLIGLLIVFSAIRSMSFFRSSMRASIKLHDKMFNSIAKATMGFFFKNSSGRVLNRFSKDISSVDEPLPHILMDIVQIILTLIGSVLSICIVNQWTLIPASIIFIIMYFIRIVFMASSRTLSRLTSTKRSLIFVHLSESIKGLTTIRAFDADDILQKEFDNCQNVHSSVSYMYLGAGRAFASWIDTVCLLYVTGIIVIALTKETYGGNVGFIITQGMGLTGMIQWGIRQFSELENQMTSVERVVEYIDVPSEKDVDIKPSPQWPQQGKLELKSVWMQYSPEDPYVLKNLNVVIKPREKIGIVGRTGAGKSSLISVLFRLVNFEGNIIIDNIDTKTISLSSLRSKISIIPQEPVLFSGSIRKNLDPFDQYTDNEIWNVLDEVKLKEFVAKLPETLYSNLAEGGSNFSVGQKQLICLARALLKNNKILILDEATANVDPQTDELLQKTIRTNFTNCTVLTIAHRLHTIMDSDKVLVMNDGYIAEFDHPYVLLQEKGVFYDLVLETGKKMSENLIEIAQKSSEDYKLRKNDINTIM